MKAKIGTLFIILGSALLVAALGLFIHNEREQDIAAKAVNGLMPQIVDAIRIQQKEPPDENVALAPSERKMTAVEIDGYEYIGFVGIPSLELELPVMKDWDYDRLKIAPCRYAGSIYTDDFVIMAHNYRKHFGSLSALRAGDTVTFTDMDGEIIYYEVVAMDVLSSTAVEEMKAGEFDLTLFTCTYSGESRITIRCDRAQ